MIEKRASVSRTREQTGADAATDATGPGRTRRPHTWIFRAESARRGQQKAAQARHEQRASAAAASVVDAVESGTDNQIVPDKQRA